MLRIADWTMLKTELRYLACLLLSFLPLYRQLWYRAALTGVSQYALDNTGNNLP
jgi:hypothetical protein